MTERTFLVPAPPPAHLHLPVVAQVPQVHIKAEPIEHDNKKVFEPESSHYEILNSEFGQAAASRAENVPSGRTVLGIYIKYSVIQCITVSITVHYFKVIVNTSALFL